MSASTAIHSVALPASARPKNSTLTPSAKAMFCHSTRWVRRDRPTVSATRRRSSLISTTVAVSMAMPVLPLPPMAKPMSARARAGASLMPSPTMAVAPRRCCISASALSLSSGNRAPRASRMPASRAMACTVARLSPLNTTVVMPRACNCAIASGAWARRVSATANRARTPWASASWVTLRPCSACCASAASRAGLDWPRSCTRRRLPSTSGWPLMWPCTPRPGRAVKCSTASADRVGAVWRAAALPAPACSAWAMARETGWSERAASSSAAWAVAVCCVADAAPSGQVCQATSVGWPCVRVPVLSNATARRWRAASSALPPLMRMPWRAAAVSALTTVTGVAITSAQGQAITSSTSAW